MATSTMNTSGLGMTFQKPPELLEPSQDCQEGYSLNELKSGDFVYKEIANDFRNAGLNVLKVECLSNYRLWRRYTYGKEEILQRNLKDPAFQLNEKYLYHGSNAKKEFVCSESLDARLSKSGHFGRGIYFSDNPLKCVKYAEKGKTTSVIFLVRVILGMSKEYPKGKKDRDLVREPEKEIPYTGWRFYDSVIGTPKDFKEFVIYGNDRALIECVITYSKSETVKQSVPSINMPSSIGPGVIHSPFIKHSEIDLVKNQRSITMPSTTGAGVIHSPFIKHSEVDLVKNRRTITMPSTIGPGVIHSPFIKHSEVDLVKNQRSITMPSTTGAGVIHSPFIKHSEVDLVKNQRSITMPSTTGAGVIHSPFIKHSKIDLVKNRRTESSRHEYPLHGANDKYGKKYTCDDGESSDSSIEVDNINRDTCDDGENSDSSIEDENINGDYSSDSSLDEEPKKKICADPVVKATMTGEDILAEKKKEFRRKTGEIRDHVIESYLSLAALDVDAAVRLLHRKDKKDKEQLNRKPVTEKKVEVTEPKKIENVKNPRVVDPHSDPEGWKQLSERDKEAIFDGLIDNFLTVTGLDDNDNNRKLGRKCLSKCDFNLDLAIVAYYNSI